MAKLHILTLNWNGLDKLKELIPSTLKSITNLDCTWYIRDNGSIDGSIEFIEQFPEIKLLKIEHNRDNFSKGMNSLFNLASPSDEDFVLLLNNDVVFKDNGSIKTMMKMFDAPDVGVVGAKLFYKGTKNIQHCGVVFNGNGVPYHLDDGKPEAKHHKKDKEFQVVTGAVWLTKAEYYKNASDAGGLDEGFHWAFDDVAACLHIKYKLGKKIVYCGKTNIEHESSASLKKNPVNKQYLNQNYNRLRNLFREYVTCDEKAYLNDPNYLAI